MGMALRIPQYTVDELDRFPDDGNRYELLGGTLLVTPGPGSAHEAVGTVLVAMFARPMLERRLWCFGRGTVRLPPLTHLEPDMLVMPPGFAPGMPWEDASEHWLAVEVMSRSSRVYDREFKRDAYLALGVREVWIVDIRDRSIEICTSPGGGRFARDVVEWQSPLGDVAVRVELDRLFAGLS